MSEIVDDTATQHRETTREVEAFSKEGLTLEEIGAKLGLGKNSVYSYLRYGHPRFPPNKRKAAFKRDGGKCMSCGVNRSLAVHHIDSPRNHGLQNLITLCSACHGDADAWKRRDPIHHKEAMQFLIKSRKQLSSNRDSSV